MKKILNKIFLFALAVIVLNCEEPDNVIYDVFDTVSRGAVLRTIDRVSSNFNRDDVTSKWEVVVEEQDLENGALLSKVNVYGSFKDNKDDGTDYSKDETLITTFESSDFATSPNGLPMATISTTLEDAAAALGLSTGQFDGGDLFTFRLELILTDGRTFSAADASGSLQGSFFKSPYQYGAGILCIPPTPLVGDYELIMVDTYGDGWDGAFLTVTIDGTSTDYTAVGTGTNHTVTVPNGAQTLSMVYSPGNFEGEHVLTIKAPSGNVVFGPSNPPPAGELGLNLCKEF